MIVVGLGNPGKKYEQTRHNVGFLVLDCLAEKLNASWKTKASWSSQVAEISLNEKKVVLLKPETFMNLSGNAVARARGFWRKTPIDQIWVIHDDVDLELGDIRIKKGGSSAGHRGINSIDNKLGSADYHRIRVGVGRPDNSKIPIDKFVLGKFAEAEQKQIREIVESACETILKQIQ
jgi:peptidyl-tRNA hydrolase, PTH1 family